jgi:cytochrome c oxidase subunit 4
MDFFISFALSDHLKKRIMEEEVKHITTYRGYLKVLILLLGLTAISVIAAWINFGAFSVAVALIIACIKSGTVLSYFMHLKFDNILFRIMAIGVFILFAIIVIITFLDYLFR